MKNESIYVSVPIKVDGIKDLENQKVETKSDDQSMNHRRKPNTFKKVFLLSVLTVFIVSMTHEKSGCRKFFEANELDEEIVGFMSSGNWDELSPKEKSATEQKVTEAKGVHGWKHNEGDWHNHDHHGGEDHWHQHDGDWHHHEGGWNPHDHHSGNGGWHGHGDWSPHGHHSGDGDWHHHSHSWDNPHGHHSGDGDWHHHSHSWDNKDEKRGHHMFGFWNHDSHSHSHDQPLPVELDSEDEAPIIDNNNNVIEDESLDHDVEESEDVEISNELESEEEPAVGEEIESMAEPSLEGLDVATREEKEVLDGNN